MQLFFNQIDKLKRYWKLKPKEVKGVLISILVVAFAISFGKWGIGDEVNIPVGLTNLLLSIIIVSITLLGRLFAQKFVAMGADYRAQYRMWSFGLLLILVVAFLINGNQKLWLLLPLIPGGIVINYMPGHRLGWVRYGLNVFGIGVASLAGPIANILMAMIFKILFTIFQLEIFYTAFVLNLVWAIWNMLPNSAS